MFIWAKQMYNPSDYTLLKKMISCALVLISIVKYFVKTKIPILIGVVESSTSSDGVRARIGPSLTSMIEL